MHTDAEKERGVAENYLLNEFRTVNAHMPRRRKSLSELLTDETPQVICGDGSTHSFRKAELAMLADMLDAEEQKELLLPILIEVSSEGQGFTVPSPKGVEAVVLGKLLDMKLLWSMNKAVIFRPHLFQLRKVLKTCTQYIFIP